MPIVITDATKFIITGKQASAPKTEVNRNDNSAYRDQYRSREGAVLLVNGKERRIGKKSQYLLDMLTLED